MHHVAQRAGRVVVTAATTFHTEVFRAGDLHMADVLAVPKGLENGVGKAQHHQVLRGFLAEIMVDAIGVAFLEGCVDDLIEMSRGGEVGAEGFFDNHPCPAAVGGVVESGIFEVDENFIKELWRGGDVKQTVAGTAAHGIDGGKFFGKPVVAIGIGKFRLVVAHRFDE